MNAYGFDQVSLKLIHSYLCDRSQKAKVSPSFSKELDILCRVPQGSILGPLLFNIDVCDLFFIDMSPDIANYADDTTPYECVPYYDKLKENLELTIYKIFHWFKYNNFKANTTKCHFYYLSISLLLQISMVQSLKVVIRKNF